MTSILSAVVDLLLAALFGGMVFFPSIVAPRVFRVLDADQAGRFLRALFPGYYAYVVAGSGLAAILIAPTDLVGAGVLALIAVSTLAVRQWLVPAINRWRDRQRAGDALAGRRFDLAHRATVWLNLAQMLAVMVLIGLRAS